MMFSRIIVLFILSFIIGSANSLSFSSFSKIAGYAKYLAIGNLTASAAGNELWSGILRDCRGKMSFSCLQKNAYSYLDNAFAERDNITVFSGLILRKNRLDYGACTKNCQDDVDENIVDTGRRGRDQKHDRKASDPNENLYTEKMSPLEEITSALRDKTVKFLATRNYELQLPEFFFDNSRITISPKEIDESGALVRIDFGKNGVEEEGRLFFKKIRKFIQNRLLMSFLALILIIKLIKVKFMFIIPFLFGVGTAKKIFLKLLLFLVPAFAHVFKLCSSYYSSHSKYHHHHHHQIAHHHHHVPVPVPVPAAVPIFDHHSHHPSHHEEEFDGYDYAHPHIQLRKDMEELKEWGIDSFGEPYDNSNIRPVAPVPPVPPALPPASYAPTFSAPQYSSPLKPNGLSYQEKPTNYPTHGQLLAYNGYLDDHKFQRRVSSQTSSSPFPQVQLANSYLQQTPISVSSSTSKSSPAPINPVYVQPTSVTKTQRVIQQVVAKNPSSSLGHASNLVLHDDTFYGPILQKLEEIFIQGGFVEESCRERLICSMYKNPSLYSPHSNLVSNVLSRDPRELKRSGTEASQRFHKYITAASFGQEGGDCIKTYTCQ
ncbi:uncharacterized protein Osi17 [Fopius arisanus]|uniref:MurB_1 protein n=1 Tax=Fopius arisanus TaxID=64838 RepID=A0A0C9PVQ4_9HYME|nr:PREDICTED: uncharacterized protein LOC105273579 [Fopius arisanus]